MILRILVKIKQILESLLFIVDLIWTKSQTSFIESEIWCKAEQNDIGPWG